MILLSLLMAAAGLAAMGLSQTGHYQWAFGARIAPTRVPLLCWGGLALAGLSLVPAMFAWGPAFGTVGWCGLLSLAAGTLLLARTYLMPPAWLRSQAAPNNDRHPRAGGDPGWQSDDLRDSGSPPTRG